MAKSDQFETSVWIISHLFCDVGHSLIVAILLGILQIGLYLIGNIFA